MIKLNSKNIIKEHIIEKRIHKYIRENGFLKKGERIVANDEVSRHFATHVIHVPVVLLKKRGKRTDFVILPYTLDDIVVAFLEQLFFGKKRLKKKKDELLLFSRITDKELTLYCRNHGLLFKPKNGKLKRYIQEFDKKHKGSLYSLYKSAQDLKDVF